MNDEIETKAMPVPADEDQTSTTVMPAALDSEQTQTQTTVIPVAADGESTEAIDLTKPIDELAQDTVVLDTQTAQETPTQNEQSDPQTQTVPMAQAASATTASQTAPMPQVPLYATQPPSSAAPTTDAPTQARGASQTNDGETVREDNPWRQAGPQPFVQVPPQRPMERPVIRKTGPSAATIVLGVLFAMVGVFTMVFGYQTPIATLDFSLDMRALLGVSLGIIGGGLVLVAVVWGIVSAMKTKSRETDRQQLFDSPNEPVTRPAEANDMSDKRDESDNDEADER